MRVYYFHHLVFLALLLGQASPYAITRPVPDKNRSFRFQQTTKLSQSQSQSSKSKDGLALSRPPLLSSHSLKPSDEETASIAFAASLLSYQCTEDRLRNALETLHANNGQHAHKYSPNITHHVRGRLEDYIVGDGDGDDRGEEEAQCDNIVDMFLTALASTTAGSTCLQAGISTCHLLQGGAGIEEDEVSPFTFTPPTRSMIGTIDGMDVALLRDKEDVNRRFSILFSVDRAKGLKIARLLAEIDEEGVVHIRGFYVHEAHRKKGLSTLLIAFFSRFCRLAFGAYPRTLVMNKPLLCVSLASLGFIAENEKWPVFVAKHEKDKDITLMSPMAGGNDLGPQFPHAVRSAQKIELVSGRPLGSRKIYVLTKFMPPNVEGFDPVEKRLENSQCQLFSARIVAFLSTLENAKDPMFRRSRGVNFSESDDDG